MLKSRIFALTLTLMVLIGTTPFRSQSQAANSTLVSAVVEPTHNKFVGRWSSRVTTASGQVIDDGVLDISEAPEPGGGEVSVVHSVRGGPVIGHTMSYPDRIEIQISLGDGRVAHYNGVLVSATKIEGRYFVTGRPQSHHAGTRLVVFEDGTWSAGAG